MIFIFASIDLQGQGGKKLALVGGMLLDGYEANPPLHHAAILIEGNKIVKVGRASEIDIPPDATVIDTSGRTMMPGLIEAHMHLGILGHGNYYEWDRKYVTRWGEVFPIAAKQLLMAGVTTAADVYSDLEWSLKCRDMVKRGEIPGPRLLVSGPCLIRGLKNVAPWQEYNYVHVDTPKDCAKATQELCEAGVDLIKVKQRRMTFEHFKAIVDTANKYGKKVHCCITSCTNYQSIKDFIKAGGWIMHHVGFGSCPPFPPEVIEMIEHSRSAVCLTAMQGLVYPLTIDFPERLQDPKLKEDFPPEIYKDIQDSLKNFHTLRYFRSMNRRMRWYEHGENFKQWINSGVVLLMGTDSGTPMNWHTEALWQEMKFHVDYGMSPKKVISAATRINARWYGLEREIGTIEEGKLADIIVIKGNPLFDMAFLSDPEHIIKDGVVYK